MKYLCLIVLLMLIASTVWAKALNLTIDELLTE